jgi:hypothetical protein
MAVIATEPRMNKTLKRISRTANLNDHRKVDRTVFIIPLRLFKAFYWLIGNKPCGLLPKYKSGFLRNNVFRFFG